MRNHLLAALGLAKPHAPSLVSVTLRAEDRLIFCSDGLWDMLSDAEIAQIALQAADPADAVGTLIAAANRAGGADNITVIVVHMRAQE